MTSYLVVGAGGLLGQDVVAALDGRSVTALGHAELDVTDRDAVASAVEGYDVVINTTAYSKVDLAETEQESAFAVNGEAVGLLAVAAARTGARLVHFSTDYVFDGTASEPYRVDHPLAPLNAYGRSKADGESRLLAAGGSPLLLRTAWLYGGHGANFPQAILRRSTEVEVLPVVSDQVGQPTWTADLAARAVAMLDAEVPSGVYHATNSGSTSWFGFARAIFERAGLDPERVVPVPSTEFPRPAPRPSFSLLDDSGWADVGLAPLRSWQDALAAAFESGAVTAP